MNYRKDLPKPFFVLAPMDDVTDTTFRQIVASTAAPDLFFTEFVNVDGLMSPGRSKLLKKLRFVASERRLVAQLWGLKPENFKTIAEQIADGTIARELGLPDGCNFVGVDLNMGCPAKSEVQNGTCSALIKPENRELAEQIIEATREGLAGRLPLSVKTRLGFSTVDMSWFEFLLGKNLDMLSVHGRTRKEMSKVPAHWDTIGDVVKLRNKLAPQTIIVGNGDVESWQQGIELAQNYGLDGIMIGRGIFHDPFVFAMADTTHSAHFEFFSSDARRCKPDTAYSASQKENPNCRGAHDVRNPWGAKTKVERVELYRRHVQLFAQTWQHGERNIKTLNKFCKVYISDFDGAKELREKLMAASSADELLTLLATA